MTVQTLVLRYSAFALCAILANLAVQRVVLAVVGEPFGIFAAMLAGAAVGLVVKYTLDRKFIFMPRGAASLSEFLGYAATGAVLTAIFFVSEYTLWRLFDSDLAREIGAIIGLVVGYTLKYRLDRHFIFAGATGNTG